MTSRTRILIRRELLLVEIERRCAHSDCLARVRVGLTKREAGEYQGFECGRCERWNDDVLWERDVPEWWAELMTKKQNDVGVDSQMLDEVAKGEPW